MKIILLHDYFDANHLDEVVSQMSDLGAPTLRGVWVEAYGAWCAIEGCHRLRAAQSLGLQPEMVEAQVGDLIEVDGVDVEITEELLNERLDGAWRRTCLDF